jgi:hypothetical protein
MEFASLIRLHLRLDYWRGFKRGVNLAVVVGDPITTGR